jgi:hypothetical protein
MLRRSKQSRTVYPLRPFAAVWPKSWMGTTRAGHRRVASWLTRAIKAGAPSWLAVESAQVTCHHVNSCHEWHPIFRIQLLGCLSQNLIGVIGKFYTGLRDDA